MTRSLMSFLEERLSKRERYKFHSYNWGGERALRLADHGPAPPGFFEDVHTYYLKEIIVELTDLVDEYLKTTSVPTSSALVHCVQQED